MAYLKNLYQDMFVFYFIFIPQHNLDCIMFMIQLPIAQKFNQYVMARCLASINTLGPFRVLNGKLNGKDLTPQIGGEAF
jgi:hypothetical protein